MHEAWLRRTFGFKWLAARTVVASILGGIVSVGMALYGFGIYAMVGQRLIIALVLTAMVWWSSPWRPKLRWSTADALSLARVGSDVSMVAVLQVANVRIIDVAVGYLFGPQILGQLRIAWRLFDFVIAVAVQPVVNVSLSALSRLQGNNAAMASATVRLIGVSGTALYPIFFGIAVVAPDVMPTLFGDKWDDAILFIQILSPISVAATINYFLSSALIAAGRTRWILWQALAQVILAVVLTVASAPFGVVPVLVANVIRASIIALVNVWLLKLAIGAAPATLGRALMPPLVAAVVMTAVLVAARPLFLEFLDIAMLRAFATALAGALLFVSVLWFGFPSWRRNMHMELKPLLPEKGQIPDEAALLPIAPRQFRRRPQCMAVAGTPARRMGRRQRRHNVRRCRYDPQQAGAADPVEDRSGLRGRLFAAAGRPHDGSWNVLGIRGPLSARAAGCLPRP